MPLFKKKTNWYKIFDSREEMEREVPLMKTTTILFGSKKICIAHSSEGFFAVNDKCPHNAGSFGRGWCTEDNAVVCPVHRYSFDLITGRAKTGIADVVRTYPLEIRENGVFIGMEENVWNLF